MLQEHRVHLPQGDAQGTPAGTATGTFATDQVNNILTNGKKQQLQKMGLITALSIAIHNLPEGLATFVAALSDPLNAGTALLPPHQLKV